MAAVFRLMIYKLEMFNTSVICKLTLGELKCHYFLHLRNRWRVNVSKKSFLHSVFLNQNVNIDHLGCMPPSVVNKKYVMI